VFTKTLSGVRDTLEAPPANTDELRKSFLQNEKMIQSLIP
jgi:hypothetical protein